MRIGIIGGGWVGCHLANKLKDEHSVVIFEKNDRLFNETSYNNQNRLHYGFHYARNHKTREMCKETFDKFMSDYGFLTSTVEKNYYCVPNLKSVMDFGTYKEIFRSYDNENVVVKLNDVEGCVNTKERYIDFKKAHEYFNQELLSYTVRADITPESIEDMTNQFDLVINATNNHIVNHLDNNFFEATLTLVYQKIKETEFDALTLVDGPFFSIYPHSDSHVTLTDVEHTPLMLFNRISDLIEYKKNIYPSMILDKKNLIEMKVKEYFPDFLDHFTFSDFFIATKAKTFSESDSRYPIIEKDGNVINCFTGKIQGIYIIEDYIKQLINENTDR